MLIASRACRAARLAAYGRGENQPVASNADAAGRAQNRRVEITIRPQLIGRNRLLTGWNCGRARRAAFLFAEIPVPVWS
ncbi:MAG: hypothetical protein U5N10_00570 [Gemmobacter sp.]|nr:hypothetical protein [Gemmobacter sp.]